MTLFHEPHRPVGKGYLEYLEQQKQKAAKRRAKEAEEEKLLAAVREKRESKRRAEEMEIAQFREMAKEQKLGRGEKKMSRLAHIVMSRERGMTLQQIGDSLQPRVTRERVRQILRKIEERYGFKIEVPKLIYMPELVILNCQSCQAEIGIEPRVFRGYGTHACLKCRQHKKWGKWLHPDGTRMTTTEIARWKYHNDPEFKKKRLAQSTAWTQKKKRENAQYREKLRAYKQEYDELGARRDRK